jgi:ubiquinone/menaquinone biosynthesis C-methylase UbiE
MVGFSSERPEGRPRAMKMNPVSRLFVNRDGHAKGNLKIMRNLLDKVELDSNRETLEIGCGAGKTTASLHADFGLQITGVDVDPYQIEKAKKLETEGLKFILSDGTTLPFPDASFDLVYSQKVLHHIEGWQDVLKEVSRVLRPGGYYLIDDFALPAALTGIIRSVWRRGVYSIAELIGTLKERGMDVVYRGRPGKVYLTEHELALKKSP